MPPNGPDSPENRPGLLKIFGIYAPKTGRYDCIFIHFRPWFCINIQPHVKDFHHSGHGYNRGRNYGMAYDGHGPCRVGPTQNVTVAVMVTPV